MEFADGIQIVESITITISTSRLVYVYDFKNMLDNGGWRGSIETLLKDHQRKIPYDNERTNW